MTAPTTLAPQTAIPSEHHVRPEVTTRLQPGTATEVRVSAGRHTFTIDEPASLGGTDLGANPVDHLLAALGACNVITYQVWADKLGIGLDGVDIELAGDLDIRGFFGIDPDVRPGFQGIEARVTLRGPESAERYAQLQAAVEEHCPVLDNLTRGVPVTVTLDLAAG
jgi:uncharacterized OsmC-like protein